MKKPFITSFVYCDQITTENIGPQSRVSLVAPFSELTPINIPGNYSFSICFMIGGITNGHNELKLSIKNDRDEVVGDIINSPIDVSIDNDKDTSIQMLVDIKNFVFQEPGIYSAEVMMNDEQIGIFPISVIKQEA